MKTPKDLLPKPSDAINAMIEGLKNHKEVGIEVDMMSFGRTVNNVCFGCAATCTILRLSKENELGITFDDVARGTWLLNQDWDEFETVIDLLRQGCHSALRDWYKAKGMPGPRKGLPRMDGSDWPQLIHHYEQYRDDLVAEGY